MTIENQTNTDTIKKYQSNLVQLLHEDCPKNKKGNRSQKNEELLLFEIRRCEQWLKTQQS